MPGWTIHHQVSEQTMIQLLRSQAKNPVAIIIVGGNDEVTEKVTAALGQSIGCGGYYAIHELTGMVDVGAIRDDVFSANNYVFINLTRGSSSAHGFRHVVVQRLYDIGAKTVAIIWVKGDSMCDNPNAHAVDEALRAEPPTTDGIDYLFVVEP